MKDAYEHFDRAAKDLFRFRDFGGSEIYLLGVRRTQVSLPVLIAALALLVAGCSESSEQGETPEPRTVVVERTVEVASEPETLEETSTAVTSEATTCEVGQACDLGESSVTVTGTQQVQSINTSLGDTFEGTFMIIEFDYTYRGNEPADLGEPPFELMDSNGNRYSLDFDATSSYGIDNNRSLIYETVQPSVAAPGTAIFEVSPDAEDFTLLVFDLVSPQSNQPVEVPLSVNEQASILPSASPSGETSTSDASPSTDSFVSTYFDAVSREDWATTYSLLDSETQGFFSEDVWLQKQTARNAAASPLPIVSTTATVISNQGPDQTVDATLSYEDGSQESVQIVLRTEDEQLRRHLTSEEIAFLQEL